ncbi:hypothetical protein [Tenacibaculum maritimum]|uniref:Uncharacterized protein n=8 Tax=Tenacibaculum maritimum TaxID=107401 RepID=A0A2H1E8A6_9FLAO|nr:hypothetical protein [Tenacibaculum maritimum]MCD9583131.1 hypothetical protein [Tenacibaculum maritimum]MCD9611666.1 hypothetical protein [Tenacibaculum maritimum]MCD9637260.1 hypothetical protein [Tenacibaculum maritimum]CAA0159747.1 hypothetical protein TFA04_110005 [Tenacibaculum maritimum]CAA0249337.1 hypothetical protein USCSP91_70005 [Tenacibaculum maritimum]
MRNIFFIFLALTNLYVFSQKETINYKKLNGETSKIKISSKYSFSNLYDYQVNSKNFDSIVTKPYRNNRLSEHLLTAKFKNKFEKNLPDAIVFSLRLISKLSIDIKDIRYEFIKFEEIDSGGFNDPKTSRIFITERQNNIRNEVVNKTNEVSLFESILKTSNVNVLFQFYNERNSKKYAEINKLKPLVKDPKGNLNIKKLAKVLEENKTLLAKYLDD